MSTMVEEPEFGPCGGWGLTGDDVAEFCPTDAGSDTALLDSYVLAAVELLFQFSGRQFSGECEATVRPCRVGCGCWNGWGSAGWPYGSISWGWGWNGTSGAWSFGWCDSGGNSVCGCRPLSEVELAGAPITSIQEILIDGVVLDPTYAGGSPQYRIDEQNLLVRMDDPDDPTVQHRWPACQNLAMPTTEEGTWSITYTYGQTPPEAALLAAKQLACGLIPGGVCMLPAGATKVVRQGVSIDRTLFLQWGMKAGSWQTGLTFVDAFLQAFNPHGYDRGPAVWSPDIPQKPRHTRV